MTSLYVDRRGVALRLDGEALAFYENDERIGTVPLAPLDRVYLRGDVTLHSNLLGKLGEHGVGVVVLSGRKGVASLLLATPHNDAARRVAQYRWSQDADFCLRFARTVVELKLREQLAFLDDLRGQDMHARYELSVRARQVSGAIESVDKQVSIAALRGLEGHAAAAYFAGLSAHLHSGLGFTGRNRRPPRDPFNAVLSLGYTLLHADTVLALYGAGLDPFVGFYHAIHFGRESLACDLMEVLRPLLDRFAVGLFKSGELHVGDFSITEQGCLMSKAARVRFYPLYEEAAESFRKQLALSIADLVDVIKSQAIASHDMPCSGEDDGEWDE
jgi:CRISPR-associated protein Cas1